MTNTVVYLYFYGRKKMLKKVLMIVAISSAAASAYAVDHTQVKQAIELKDGSTVYIFKDGKMGMEDKFGKARTMKEGAIMETKDGQKIMMKGNEIYRIENLRPWLKPGG
jgi:hypothetical protein